MARTRTIKPSFFDHEALASVSAHARLAFIGIWTEADRDGRLKDTPGRLRVRLFPYEPTVDMDALMDELQAIRVIVRYEVDGDRFVEIPGFAEHQKPHPKEAKSTIEPWKGAASREMPRKEIARLASFREPSRSTDPSTLAVAETASSASGLKPLIRKRNLHAAFEHPRFDVPQWWHDEKVRGLSGGESRIAKFYDWLSARVERTNEDTEPRKPWLNAAFEAWLVETAAPKSAYPSPEETRRMIAEREAMAGK